MLVANKERDETANLEEDDFDTPDSGRAPGFVTCGNCVICFPTDFSVRVEDMHEIALISMTSRRRHCVQNR